MPKATHHRQWLDRPGQADSYVTTDIWPIESGWRNKPQRNIDFKLADCTHPIFISFGYYSEQERKRKLRKLVVLEKALARIRAALEEEYVDPDEG